MGLVSNSHRVNSHRVLVDAVVRSVGADGFAVTVSANDVIRAKPDPEPYLAAAARLGVSPRRYVVLEDSMGCGTAHRAVALLKAEGLIEAQRGHRSVVTADRA